MQNEGADALRDGVSAALRSFTPVVVALNAGGGSSSRLSCQAALPLLGSGVDKTQWELGDVALSQGLMDGVLPPASLPALLVPGSG